MADLAGAVQQRAEQGVDFVDGGPAPYETQFSRDELATLVDTARNLGLPVTVHAHAAAAIACPAALGVDTIEHATWVTGPQSVNYDEAVARSLADQRIAVTITGSLNWRRIVAQVGKTRARENFYGRISWLDDLEVCPSCWVRRQAARTPCSTTSSPRWKWPPGPVSRAGG